MILLCAQSKANGRRVLAIMTDADFAKIRLGIWEEIVRYSSVTKA